MKFETGAGKLSNQLDIDDVNAGDACQAIEKLITAYQLEKRNLELSIERGEFKEIQVCDSRVAARFDALILTSPKDPAEIRKLVNFLLDELCPVNEGSDLRLQTLAKIKSLMASL